MFMHGFYGTMSNTTYDPQCYNHQCKVHSVLSLSLIHHELHKEAESLPPVEDEDTNIQIGLKDGYMTCEDLELMGRKLAEQCRNKLKGVHEDQH